jgi:hypothetical protein
MKKMAWRRRTLALLAGGICAGLDAAADEAPHPWRLSKALDLPEWLSIAGTHRSRYETLDWLFRTGGKGGDQMLAIRTTLRADLKHERFRLAAEVMDSQHVLADSGTPIDTSMVNSLELLQAFGSFKWEGSGGGSGEVRAGRQTLDLGSRRLVARNSFRNTANAFTGALWHWKSKEGSALKAFYFLPHTRLPSDAPSLLDNQAQIDRESFDLQFWGLHSEWSEVAFGGTGEAYFFALHEEDGSGVPTRNRQLFTPGLRFCRAAAEGSWDWDFESVLQFGQARSSTAEADTRDLDHFAHFHHAEIGYTVDLGWSPRAALLWDYASGDEDPADDQSNRFDTLFGARRFDHGPTGIYGAFARSNIQSPALSLSARPAAAVEAEIKHRLYWLASATDAWTTSGVRDATGRSGSFVGHQLEAMVRWDILPGNLRLEIGGAHLFSGEFIERAPNAAHRGDSSFGYASVEMRF